MLETFLLSMCLASRMNGDACTKSLDGYRHTPTLLNDSEHNFNRMYIDPLPEDLKILGGFIGTAAKREIHFAVHSGMIIKLDFNSGAILGTQISY